MVFLKNLLNRWFGKKVKIVTATCLYGFAEHEQQFIFPASTTKEQIENTLWNRKYGRMDRFSVKYTISMRSKDEKYACPPEGKYRPITDTKITKWYDD